MRLQDRSEGAGAPPRPARARFFWILAAASLVGAGLALVRGVTHGVALHSDSFEYLATARNLVSGLGLLNYDGGNYMSWPPLYPLVLAASTLGIFDPLTVAAPLNAAAFAAIVFVSGMTLRRRLRSPLAALLALWASFVLALSVPLGDFAWWALSGPMFALLTILALAQVARYLDEGRTAALVWCGLFSALAWQTRYIGIAVPATVSLLLLCDRRAGFGRRALRSALFFALAALPMAAWIARSYALLGGFSGNRRPVDNTLSEVLGELVSGLSAWARFDLAGGPLLLAAVLLPAAALLVGRPGAGTAGRRASNSRLTAVFGVFVLVYAVALVAAVFSGFTWHGVQERFLAPLYAPLVVALASVLDDLLEWRRSRRLRPPGPMLAQVWPLWARLGPRAPTGFEVGVAAALSIWLAGQVAPNIEAVARAAAPDAAFDGGYHAQPWASSETLRYLRENEVPEQIYSNLALLTHHHTWRRAASESLPESRGIGRVVQARNPRPPEEQLRRWFDRRARDGALVVWFHAYANFAFDYGPPLMRVTPGFEMVAEFPDGAIFRVDREYRPPTNRYRDAYRALASGAFGEPVARENFDLFLDLDRRRLLYAKEPCADEDLEPRFLFHLFPAAPEERPTYRRDAGHENRDFTFPQFGLRFGDRCLAIVPLPDEDLARIRTGQWRTGEDPLWNVSLRLDHDRYRAEWEAISSGARGEPAARSPFDLYLDRVALTYLKEACAPEEVDTRFFLHFYPKSPDDLPLPSFGLDFENRDFDFREAGLFVDGKCIGAVGLPEYPVARIRTGQWRSGAGELWSVWLTPPG